MGAAWCWGGIMGGGAMPIGGGAICGGMPIWGGGTPPIGGTPMGGAYIALFWSVVRSAICCTAARRRPREAHKS